MAKETVSQDEFERILEIESKLKPSLFDSLLVARRSENDQILQELVTHHKQKMERKARLDALTESAQGWEQELKTKHNKRLQVAIGLCALPATYNFYLATPTSVLLGLLIIVVAGFGLYSRHRVTLESQQFIRELQRTTYR